MSQDKGMNPLVAAGVGVAVGAAIAVLSNEKRRQTLVKKLRSVMDEAATRAEDYKDDVRERVDEIKSQAAQKVRTIADRVDDAKDEAVEAVDQTQERAKRLAQDARTKR